MNKKILKIFSVVLLLFLMGFMGLNKDKYYKIAKSIDVFGRILKQVNNNYVDEIDIEQFMLAGIRGMLSTLDPYTVYLDKSSQKDFSLITRGKYGGIGATIALQNGKVTVVGLLEGYSAQRQGLRIGDIIVKIDTQNISADNYYELSSYLKKTPGNELKLTVEREGFARKIVFNLITEEIILKNVSFADFIPDTSNNAYIKLSSFNKSAGEEIRNSIFELRKRKHINSLILDLRGNPGGLLDAAIDICDELLPKGKLIVSVEGKNSVEKSKFYSSEKPIVDNVPIAILINGGSASAAEIVTGAIQDHDRGVVIGTNSFGKGLVQTLIPLTSTTSLKLTTGKYYTPSGRSIQRIDYSHQNKVFINHDGLKKSEFNSDNQRPLYSAGGIEPDTVVYLNKFSRIMNFLLTKGMFFKFATNYYNLHPETDFIHLPSVKIITSFLGYLNKNKFKYTSNAEVLFDNLDKEFSNSSVPESISLELNKLRSSFLKFKENELIAHESEIVDKIKQEFAARLFGRKGRIKESLKNDNQLNAAIKILSEHNLYNKLLNLID